MREARDGTRKLSFRLLNGGGSVESVLIPSAGRMTLCISSQLGCAMNCQARPGARGQAAGLPLARAAWLSRRLG